MDKKETYKLNLTWEEIEEQAKFNKLKDKKRPVRTRVYI